MVNPADLDGRQAAVGELTAQGSGVELCDLQSDERVGLGGAIVRTAEGEVDASVHTQLERAREVVELVAGRASTSAALSEPPGSLLEQRRRGDPRGRPRQAPRLRQQPDRADHRGHRPAGRGRRGVPRGHRPQPRPGGRSAEVVGFRDGRTLLMPLGELHGIGPGTRVLATGAPFRVAVGDGLLGRIVDGLGIPEDGAAAGRRARSSRARRSPRRPSALSRPRIRERVGLGVRALDGLVPCGRGQRLGIFAGSGVGKSSLLGMIARSTSASINVIALVGERGREVREFIERDLGDALERSVVVVATSDQPALVRIKAAFTATTIAEYFRDQGHDVMLMMDSVTRFAMAQREVGLAIGEPPATRGYTPERVRAAAAAARARRHEHQRLDHRPLHGAGRRRRHERADRRRRALDPRRARRPHPLARPRRSLPGDRRPAERLAAGRARSSRPRSSRPASSCARRWRCCTRRKTSSRSAPTSAGSDPALDTALAHRAQDRALPAPARARAQRSAADRRAAARARLLARARARAGQRRDPRRRGGLRRARPPARAPTARGRRRSPRSD